MLQQIESTQQSETLQQIETMLRLQNDMNTRIHPQWREQGNAWYRAIWVETAEMLDHYGWKWWKKQTPDLEQVRLELVDVWHFGLSILLEKDTAASEIQRQLALGLEAATEADFREELERFVASTLQTRGFDIGGFGRLMRGVDLSSTELFHHYVGKNVLNFFRQDNGYLDGSYRKIWQGREDNEHLAEIISILDGATSDFSSRLYAELQQRYHEVS